MEQTLCIGCKTSFQEGETIDSQEAAIQFKNCSIPFKDETVKWSVLKSIVSFLNSKGGVIYIGIDEKQGTVKGLFLERKERDNFKLSTKQLIEKIYPKVDLNHKQEVQIHFVPIFKGDNNNFEGKFVIKIIVQPGDPTQAYCLSERIRLQEQNKEVNSKTDEFEVFYAYERKTTGSTLEVKGVNLMNFIYEKAKDGAKVTSVFHEGCNPEPPYLDLQIQTIWLSNLDQFQFELLNGCYEEQFDKMNIDYTINYNKQTKVAQIYIEDEQDFQEIKSYIVDNLDYLNSLFKDTEDPIELTVKGEVQHYFLIANKGDKNKKEKKTEGAVKRQSPKKMPRFPYQERKIEKKEFKPPVIPQPKPKIEEKAVNMESKGNNVLVFTHIAPQSIDSLQRFLRNSIYRGYDKVFTHYFNTLQLQFSNEKQLQNYLAELLHKQNQLASYGFKRQIRYGFCENKLKICNFDFGKIKQLKSTLKELMQESLIDIKNDKNAIICEMATREAACLWLDDLLEERAFKKSFGIKGHHKDAVPKMKIYLQVTHVVKN